MAFIRTVLGDITPSEFGVCDAHDHMIRSGGPEVLEDKDFLLDDVEASKKELKRWAAAGGRSMVCMDPIGCGFPLRRPILRRTWPSGAPLR